MSETTAPQPQHNSPWLFALLSAPGGICYWGVSALVIPYLLRRHGVPVDRIAAMAAIANIPTFCFFLCAPIIDLGLSRRAWILLTSGIGALCSSLAVKECSGSLTWLVILWSVSNGIGSIEQTATAAVMTALPRDRKGRASGWYQLGNIGIGALGGGAAIWLADRLGIAALALSVAALSLAPALSAFWISEIPHQRMAPSSLFQALARDIWAILWSGRTFVVVLFLCAPVGAGAVGNLISSVGPDYYASGAEIAWVSGLGGSVLLGLGSLVGGFICDRLHRMTAYALFGIVAAVFGAWLALAPRTPFNYGAGYAGYALSTGLAFAAFTALVLDVIGHGRRAAGSGYSILMSLGNLPIVYMTWLDGLGYKHAGVRGLMSVDALANGLCGLLLLFLARVCARRWSASDEELTRPLAQVS